MPETVVVEIGQTEYKLTPQPMRRYLEFEDRLRELLAGWSPLAEPKEEEEDEGLEEGEGEDLAEKAIKPLVEQGVEAVHEVLRCMIPNLELEDVWEAPEPQLEHVLKLCLEINGGQWAQALIRDFFTPLLPAAQALLANWLLSLGGGKTTPTEGGAAP